MAEQTTISLDDEAYAFLTQTAGHNQSAYINQLLIKEKRRALEETVLKANHEESKDLECQQNLSEWDATLSDGLNS